MTTIIPREADWDDAPSLLDGAANVELTVEQCDLAYWFSSVAQGTLRGRPHRTRSPRSARRDAPHRLSQALSARQERRRCASTPRPPGRLPMKLVISCCVVIALVACHKSNGSGPDAPANCGVFGTACAGNGDCCLTGVLIGAGSRGRRGVGDGARSDRGLVEVPCEGGVPGVQRRIAVGIRGVGQPAHERERGANDGHPRRRSARLARGLDRREGARAWRKDPPTLSSFAA